MKQMLKQVHVRSAGIGAGATILVLVVIVGLLIGFSSRGGTFSAVSSGLAPGGAPMAPAYDSGYASEEAARESVVSTGAGLPGSSALNQQQTTDQQTDQQGFQRLVIKTADLSLEVPDVAAADATVRQRAGELGGFVVDASTSGTGADLTARITFRVPSERFDEALASAQGIANRVLSRSVSGQDVTEEFVDLDSRMRSLSASRDRLIALLEKAQNVSEAVEANNALTQIQSEIEMIQGRMRYLQQSASLSTITVNLYPIPTTPIISEEGWQPLEVARGALRNLLEFGQWLVELAIVLVIWVPLWGPIAFGVWRWWRGRKAHTPKA